MKSLTGHLERIADRVDGLPEWLRPAAYGPMLILLMMSMRGAFVIGPIVIAIGLLQSERPFYHFGVGAGLFALLLAGSAVGGLLYGIVGRPIKRLPLLGPYLAGVLATTPYFVTMIPLLRLSDGEALRGPVSDAELFAVSICSVLFGSLIGHMMFRPETPTTAANSASAGSK